MAGSRKNSANKRTMLAIRLMEERQIEPILMLNEVYEEAMKSYRMHRGYGDKFDAGTHYLATAYQAANSLVRYKHASITGMSMADIGKESVEDREPMTSKEALDYMKKDPFHPDNERDVSPPIGSEPEKCQDSRENTSVDDNAKAPDGSQFNTGFIPDLDQS